MVIEPKPPTFFFLTSAPTSPPDELPPVDDARPEAWLRRVSHAGRAPLFPSSRNRTKRPHPTLARRFSGPAPISGSGSRATRPTSRQGPSRTEASSSAAVRHALHPPPETPPNLVRIEETTVLTVADLSFARGAEEIRVARGKGNKERLGPIGTRLRRSLRHYLRTRDVLVPADAEAPSPTSSSPRRAFV